MRKFRTPSFVLILFVLLLTVSVFAAPYKRAPEILPGTNPQWRNPSFWISQMKNPDEVILSVEAIQQINDNYRKKIRMPEPFKGLIKERTPDLYHWWPGFVLFAPDFKNMSSRSVADTIRERIKIQIEYLRSSPYGNNNAIEYSEADIDAFEHEMALDRVRNDIQVRSGIAVKTIQIRNIPSFSPMEIGLADIGERRYDMFNVCLLKIGKPVTILHPSRSGEYILVSSDDAYGWARSEDIAFGNEDAIEQFTNPDRFVVCTGDRVMVYSDETCTYASGWFGMGDRLPRANSNNPRHVKIPVRMANGQLIYETAWLAEDADVHEGWLPYTRRNIVETAFKLMDNSYDFNGGHFGRNHETTYRDIFACFGFELPFHGALFTHFNRNKHNEDVAFPDPENKSREQFKVILSHEPFVSLHCAGGHAQLLLGERNGVPVVLDHHGYEYKTEDGTVYKVRRTCVGEMTNPGITGYMLRRPLTSLELR
jgi:hypothetical protein